MSLFDEVKISTQIEPYNEAEIATLTATNLPSGYGYTLGSALRRILLSSLEGSAVVGVRITGVTHEFSTIKGVKEGVYEILINIKRVRFALDGASEAVAILKLPKSGVVKAKDIEVPSNVKIANPDLKIAEVSKLSGTVKIEMDIKKGTGYNYTELSDRTEIGYIPLDADFSPVKRVDMDVEKVRFGEKTDLDKLTMQILTDGSIGPLEAVDQSIDILKKSLNAFEDILKGGNEPAEEKQPQESAEAWDIDSIDIPTKVKNALTNSGVDDLNKLVKLSEAELLDLPGVGEKAVKDVQKALKKIGLTLEEK